METHRVRSGKVARTPLVLFDTSFLISVMEHPTSWREDMLDRLGNFRPIVIRPVYEELSRLAARETRGARYASLAKAMVDRGELELQDSVGDGPADDELMSRALEEGAIVATVDNELIRQLSSSKVPVLRLSRGRVTDG